MNTGFMTVYWRDMLRFFRFRTLLISSLVQPALWMAFFGIAMSSSFDRFSMGVPAVPGAEAVGYLTFMAAGVIAMTTLFTSLFGGIVLLFDKNWGLMREILASPLPRSHIIIGIALSGMTKSFIQAIIIMVFGLCWEWNFSGVCLPRGYSWPSRVSSFLSGCFLSASSSCRQRYPYPWRAPRGCRESSPS